MLKNLSIKNVALIRFAEIEFAKGLNVLSGETGAGKSVVLEALNFSLGQKADKSMICHGEKDCSVTCSFDISGNDSVKKELDELGIEYDEEIIVKRTLNVDGKSAIRLNGESVTAGMLRKVTSLLVDIHGQSDHFLLLKESNQLALIDGLGGEKITAIKDKIDDYLQQIREIDHSLKTLGGDEATRARRMDYLEFAIREIENVNVGENEETDLSDRKKKLLNLEKIANACSESFEALSAENGVTDILSNVCRRISAIKQYGTEYEDLSTRLSAVLDEVTDISELINDCCDEEFNPEELEEIETRLNSINALKRKYGKTYKEITETLEKFKAELELIGDSAEKSEKLAKERLSVLDRLESYYDVLTEERKKVSENLSKKLSDKLKELAMKGAEFKVEFMSQEGEVLSTKGRDLVCFMFTANKGETLKPLSKIISGGELSRLMLGIKAVTGGNFGAETFIFDEIDVGISGEAAEVVAKNFAYISKDRQIVAISHLPQIVAMADVGFLISKNEEGERTVTHVTKLDESGKVGEVLRLVGGNADSNAAFIHAREMVERADKFKSTI